MTPEHWQRINELFGRLLQLPASEQRQFIEAQAGGEPEIATLLLSMLKNDARSSFLDDGATAIARNLLRDPVEDTIGPYRRIGCLGQGGMGVVYLAEHMEWKTHVAVKVPGDAWISPDRRERFFAEQRLLAQLTHPGIARIYEGGTGPNGTPWFAMEYVEGEPITLYARGHKLTVEGRLRLFRQACEAVQYAHSQAIIHRDLKPSNIFVTPQEQVKLLDFGIAKQLEEIGTGLTRTGAQPLTIAYAAPEQVSVNRISVQSDVYSLGVTLYELLTDRLPFDLTGLTPSQAEQIISTKIPDRPSSSSSLALRRIEWTDLDVLVAKTLHKDVAQRYGSVDGLIRDINHFLKREPLDARPDSVIYRLRKFVQRRRVPVTVSLAVVLILASITAYFTWSLAKARDAAVAQANREHQIQQFMTDLFSGGDQVNGPSKDLRVIDMLAAGVQKADQFEHDPVVQADLYGTLGTVYQSLGDLGQAERVLQMALARASEAGQQSAQTAEMLAYLGRLRQDQGKFPDAENNLRKSITILQQPKQSDPALIARYEVGLAGILIDEARYQEAGALLKQAESTQRRSPETHDQLLENYNLQAVVDIDIHRYPEAERVTRYLIADNKRRHPVPRPDDTNDLLNLGAILDRQFKYKEAEQSYREALRIDESFFPEGHPETADVRRLLAQVLNEEGKYQEAVPIARSALRDLEHVYGPWHRRVAYALRVLSTGALKRNDLTEALADVEREIAIYKKIGDKADLPKALANLADIEVKKKDYRRAESLYEEAVRGFPSTELANDIAFAHAQLALGELRVDEQRYREAESPLLASLALWKQQPVSRKQQTKETLAYLIKTYNGLHQPDKANDYQQQLGAIEVLAPQQVDTPH